MAFLRILLVLTALASGGVIYLGEMNLKPKLDKLAEDQKKVSEERDKERENGKKLKTELDDTKTKRDALQNDLDQSKKAEADAVKAAEDEKQKTAAAVQATAAAKQETATVRKEGEEYFKLKDQGLTPPVIRNIAAELPMRTNELNTLKREQQLINVQLVKKTGELNAFLNPKGAVALPPGLIGKVKAYDPKWEFVVLDIGANHGLLKNGELTISREGKLIARVKLDKVETDYATANVIKGFKLGEIKEGDAVLTPSPTVLPPQK